MGSFDYVQLAPHFAQDDRAEIGHWWLVSGPVATSFAAGVAVVEAVVAESDVELSLAKDAVFFAFTAFFGLLADAAAGFSFGGHGESVAPVRWRNR